MLRATGFAPSRNWQAVNFFKLAVYLASMRYGVENLFKMDRKSPLGFLIVIHISDETLEK